MPVQCLYKAAHHYLWLLVNNSQSYLASASLGWQVPQPSLPRRWLINPGFAFQPSLVRSGPVGDQPVAAWPDRLRHQLLELSLIRKEGSSPHGSPKPNSPLFGFSGSVDSGSEDDQ